MTKTTNAKPTLTAAAIIIYLLSAVAAVFAEVPIVAPKQRVEREFRQLEVTLTRFMYNTVLPAPNIEAMNSALYRFMKENPGVVRFLRTNAAGITVCDVNSDSQRPEPPRNISAQRWLQYVTQNKAPYYSMDYDTANGITLFYAWPLMTGPDMSRFSGAFAAMIDFTAHTALIDDAAPFQLSYRGRAFFQHEWEDVDYNEEELEIKGAKFLTIRTELPVPTRLTQQQQRRRAPTAETEITPEEYNTIEAEVLPEGGAKAGKAKKAAPAIPVRTVIYIIVVIAALIFAYRFYTNRFGESSSNYLVMEDVPPAPPRNPTGRLTAVPQTQTIPAQQQMPLTAPPPILPPEQMPRPAPSSAAINAAQQHQQNTAGGKQEIDQQAMMSKMLGLIKQEFVIMDKKIQALAQRIERLEKR